MTVKNTYVSYRRTYSKNYQSETFEHGMDLVNVNAAAVARARLLCKAIVNQALGQKIGMTRRRLNELSEEFYGTSWQEVSTGIPVGDEEL